MDNRLNNILLSINSIQHLKKMRMLNPEISKMLLLNPEKTSTLIESAAAISELFNGPFELPDESVCGPISIGLTRNNLKAGFFPHEYTWLLGGQPNVGKTTLMRVVISQILLNNPLID